MPNAARNRLVGATLVVARRWAYPVLGHGTGQARPLLFLACLWLPGCSDAPDEVASAGLPAVPSAQSLRFGTSNPMVTFDPHLADTGPQFSTYLTLVYDGLTLLNIESAFEPHPGLATSWSWPDDNTIDLTLRRGVRFIDGERFDAHAAKANIDRLMELKGPRINTVASMYAADVLDEYTLRLHLNYPDPTLLYNLGLSPGLMVSPAAFDNPDLDLNPVGTGPWLYDRARSTLGEVLHFVPDPDHWDPEFHDAPPIAVHKLANNRARLNALISGQIDLAIVGATEAEPARDQGFAVTSRANRWFGLTILDRAGDLVPEMGDPRVRQALGFAVDRQAIADAVYFGHARPTSQPMHRDNLGHDPELESFFSYDPARARALLDEAGIDTFTFTVPVTAGSIPQYEAVQAYLRRVGIDMRIRVIEPGSVAALARSRDYPVNTIGYPNFDPDSRHPAIWSVTAGFNPFGYEDPRLERLAAEAIRSLDEDLRARNYREYFNVVVKDVLTLVYLQIDDLVIYDADKLTGVRIGRYIDPLLREIRVKPAARALARSTGVGPAAADASLRRLESAGLLDSNDLESPGPPP